MKKQIADKWIEALRSGEYKQGRGKLQKGDDFCCLGVLCRVLEKEGVKVSKNSEGEIEGDTLWLQPAVMYRAGIEHEEVFLLDTRLTLLNDGKTSLSPRLTFDEIADLIQINWREL